MHVFWEHEEWPGVRVDSPVTCLSWYPVPDGTEGLLSSGSQSGSVGITRTDLKPRIEPSPPTKRVNFNLRGHHNAISIVSWNQPQSKLATCDESGIIYVWVPYEERWSVELVNDRGVKVRDFAWSPNGSAALICYEDNFVLIGSAQGQRIWSNVFGNGESVLCGAWSPQSDQVIIGSTQGRLTLLTEQGASIGEYDLWEDHAIQRLTWSAQRSSDFKSTICVSFPEGHFHLMDSCDDADPIIRCHGLNEVGAQWTSNGEFLAVAGTKIGSDKTHNAVVVYKNTGAQFYASDIPFGCSKPLNAFTWAHDDQCLIFTAGGEMSVARVITEVPSLQMLISYRVWGLLRGPLDFAHLPIPAMEKSMINLHNYHIIQCQIPTHEELCAAACRPNSWRWYCTIQPVPKQAQTYTLCMEHMGGLIPVLRGKQINKLLPEFDIRLYNPKGRERDGDKSPGRSRSATPESPNLRATTSRENAEEESPNSNLQRRNFQRDSMWRRSKRQLQAMVQRAQQHAQAAAQYKKEEKLVQVTSNVWCTRFKVLGVATQFLPPYLGQVLYKTSVLHLQPRQMTVQVVDLGQKSILVPPPNDPENDGADENLMKQPDEGPPVAPLDTEIFFGGAREEGGFGGEDRLLLQEQALLNQVLGEFNDLRIAVDNHIQRMRDFATDLQQSSQQLQRNGNPLEGGGVPSTSKQNPMEAGLSRLAEMTSLGTEILEKETSDGSGSGAGGDAAKHESDWEKELADLDFIDEDESVQLTSENEIKRLRARALSFGGNESSPQVGPAAFSTPTQRLQSRNSSRKGHGRSFPQQRMPLERNPSDASSSREASAAFVRPPSRNSSKQLKEITSVLDKLYKLANELTARPGVTDSGGGGNNGGPMSGGKIAPNTERVPAVLMEADPGPYTELRTRIREIAQRVSQLERRINYGNELLDEVRSDLQKRVHRIRDVLGDRPKECGVRGGGGPGGGGKEGAEGGGGKRKGEEVETEKKKEVLVLQNKAPFWNEQSQVYQLDFGGRVTQESAKNFQIEHEETQVMQFGRIENGAYTLDFQAPFSAVQAFAVALASITQRLK